MKYKTALFIGRFQPFHNGHLYSLHKCLEIAESVTIVIARSNVSGVQDDPWDVRTRKMMVCEVVRVERIENKVAHIVSCPDYPSDSRWVSEIKKRARMSPPAGGDVVVSNNPWTLKVMEEAGYPVIESGLYKRDELEGKKIRELMRVGDEGWRLRVPEVILKILNSKH